MLVKTRPLERVPPLVASHSPHAAAWPTWDSFLAIPPTRRFHQPQAISVTAPTSFQFQGMNEAEFNADVNVKASIKSGIEAALTGVTVNIDTIVATDASERRLSSSDPEAADRRRLGPLDAVDVSLEAVMEIGASDASTTFDALKAALSTKVTLELWTTCNLIR